MINLKIFYVFIIYCKIYKYINDIVYVYDESRRYWATPQWYLPESV